jgi:hypothetical protein
VTASQQVGTKVEEIVYFAVVNHPDRAIFAAHRLVARAEVDNAKPAMPQPNRPGAIFSRSVWAAMPDQVHHPVKKLRLNRLLAIKI